MNNMKIVRLLMVETGTYNDLALRPYNSHLDSKTVSMFQDATRGGQHLAPENLAGVAGHVLRPSTVASGQIQIPNGFSTTRFRFMMEVVTRSGSDFSQQENVQYLCGYTDHAEVSLSKLLDPKMRLFFNSSVLTRRNVQMTPFGRQSVQHVADASHVIINRDDQNYAFGQANQNPHLMRPQDVFYSMGINSSHMGADTVDFRSIMRPGMVHKSNRSNTNTSTYLSKVLTNYRSVMQNNEDGGDDMANIMAKGGGLVRDALITADPFLGQLQVNSYTSFTEGGSVTYGELCAISPGLDEGDVVQVLVRSRHGLQSPGAFGMSDTHVRGQTEGWMGNTNETVMATIISQSVPSLMADLMLTKVAFMATNETINGAFAVQLVGGESFAENLDLTPYLQNFQRRLTHEILQELTQNNLITVALRCEIDLLGDTRINISVMGGPEVPYVMPSFCDALALPVIAPDARTLHVLANDVSSLADNLSVDYSIPSTMGAFSPHHYNGAAYTQPDHNFGMMNNGHPSAL